MTWLLPLTYTRPKLVRYPSTVSVDSQGSQRKASFDNVSSQRGIPGSLTFDKIIGGETCPPLTIRDFMNYLVYVERDAENLQFFLWHNDYVKRFESADTADVALAPVWTEAMQEQVMERLRKDRAEKSRSEPPLADMFRGTDFEKSNLVEMKPPTAFLTSPLTPTGDEEGTMYTASSTTLSQPDIGSRVATAFGHAGARQPFTIQPFREEINRIITTYIMDGSARQLNLSSWEQKAAVQALSYTTHPSALAGLIYGTETSLRRQAHPNFIRWSIRNGNQARVHFARFLGMFLIVAGLAAALVMTLAGVPRGWRALAAIGWVMGASTLFAAWKGMCVVLHGMHHRHVRPWELFEQDDDVSVTELSDKGHKMASFESFGSGNSYEDEPWVAKYEKRNLVRKVFDREVWVQEPALRQTQDTIFVQALIVGLAVGGLLTAIFVVVPGLG